MNNRLNNLEVLVIDDQKDFFSSYTHYLKKHFSAQVDYATSPIEAFRFLSSKLYDIVICDVKVTYKKANYGGLILAEEISNILGADSVLTVSGFVNKDYVVEYNNRFSFLAKPNITNIENWFDNTLKEQIESMVKRQKVFIAMPFGNDVLNNLFEEHIASSIKKSGFLPLRMDKFPFTGFIPLSISTHIKDSHLFIYLADGLSPSVFFEAGMATTLGKRTILCTSSSNILPFDVNQYNYIEYNNNGKSLANELDKLIIGLRKGFYN